MRTRTPRGLCKYTIYSDYKAILIDVLCSYNDLLPLEKQTPEERLQPHFTEIYQPFKNWRAESIFAIHILHRHIKLESGCVLYTERQGNICLTLVKRKDDIDWENTCPYNLRLLNNEFVPIDFRKRETVRENDNTKDFLADVGEVLTRLGFREVVGLQLRLWQTGKWVEVVYDDGAILYQVKEFPPESRGIASGWFGDKNMKTMTGDVSHMYDDQGNHTKVVGSAPRSFKEAKSELQKLGLLSADSDVEM